MNKVLLFTPCPVTIKYKFYSREKAPYFLCLYKIIKIPGQYSYDEWYLAVFARAFW
mgnify:FL=1